MLLHFPFKAMHHPKLSNGLPSSFLSCSSHTHSSHQIRQLDTFNNLSCTYLESSLETTPKKKGAGVLIALLGLLSQLSLCN